MGGLREAAAGEGGDCALMCGQWIIHPLYVVLQVLRKTRMLGFNHCFGKQVAWASHWHSVSYTVAVVKAGVG